MVEASKSPAHFFGQSRTSVELIGPTGPSIPFKPHRSVKLSFVFCGDLSPLLLGRQRPVPATSAFAVGVVEHSSASLARTDAVACGCRHLARLSEVMRDYLFTLGRRQRRDRRTEHDATC